MKYLITALIFSLLISCATTTPSNYSRIEYEAGACFGFCPIFKLTVNPDRTAVIEAERFTFTDNNTKDGFSGPREGTFTTTLKEEDYNKLISLLNNLNPKTLKAFYGNKNVTDLPTAYLRLEFADGTKKKIEDYGKHGTENLREFYDFVEGLRKSQTWIKVQN